MGYHFLFMQIFNFLLKIVGCENYPEKSFSKNVEDHTTCSYSISTICAFDNEKITMINAEAMIA